MQKVLVTGTSVRSELLFPLVEAGYEVVFRPADMNEDELIESLVGCSAYILGGEETATRRVIESSPDLKVISFLGVGYQLYVDEDAARENDILITNTPDVLGDSVAEFCVAQLISMNRAIFENRMVSMEETIGYEKKSHQLTGSRVGIIGMGAVGSRVSRILSSAFGCSVSYYSRTRKPDVEQRDGAVYVDFPELLSGCDSLVVCVEKNEDTIGLFNWDSLSRITKPLTVINVSSAVVLDPTAVLIGLQENKIRSISYDVFYSQDTPGARSLLEFGADRVVVTRHIGSLTHTARDAMGMAAVQNVLESVASAEKYVPSARAR